MSDTESSGDAGSTGTESTTTTAPVEQSKTLTQSQIDSIIGRAEKKAASDARKSVIEELGMDVSEAIKLRESTTKAEQDAMSETEKLTRKNAELEALNTKIQEDAAGVLATARITAALAPHMSMAAIRRIAPTIHVEADATDEDLDLIVEDLREEVPGLFGTPATASPPPGTSSQNRLRPASKTTGGDEQETLTKWVDTWMGSNSGNQELPLL